MNNHVSSLETLLGRELNAEEVQRVQRNMEYSA